MAIWPWYGGLVKGWLYDAAEFLSVQDHTNVARWADQLFARPAVARGRKVNRTSGAPSSQLRERHDASEFDTRTERKSTRLNSSHYCETRMPYSACKKTKQKEDIN